MIVIFTPPPTTSQNLAYNGLRTILIKNNILCRIYEMLYDYMTFVYITQSNCVLLLEFCKKQHFEMHVKETNIIKSIKYNMLLYFTTEQSF